MSTKGMLDPTSMESKKSTYANSGTVQGNESISNETIQKHALQQSSAPQPLRLLQYGLKVPNHQHTQLNQTIKQQQPPQRNFHIHQHLHQPQVPYQPSAAHQHPQQPFRQVQNTNVYQNQLYHQYQTQHPHEHIQKQQTSQGQSPPQIKNNLNQQNSQIWVPHQAPTHYHTTHQLKGEQNVTKPAASTTKQSKEIEKKKSSGGNSQQQLRSPSAKRPIEAPVTMQGWLHKQGSEGWMLWKKRWFVLSEYCLFYYKGPEEEKLLGSILLPSYKVSICTPDDKVNKKHAFKCEHVNMRTYILAADSHELMMRWVKVLAMACNLQTCMESEQQQQPISYSADQRQPENLTSSNSQGRQVPRLRITSNHTHSIDNTTDISNPSQYESSQYSQPLYANAPPKPRRLTDGCSSPSPDIIERYSVESKYLGHQCPPQPIYISRSLEKSPINVYSNQQMEHYSYSPRPPQMYQKHPLNSPDFIRDQNVMVQCMERRTPDTYGRSNLHHVRSLRSSDYEDVYGDHSMYKRPLSPVAYNSGSKLNPAANVAGQRPYTPIFIQGPKDNLQYMPPPQMRKIPNTVPRPHSADFLEYEVKHSETNTIVMRQPRPKSSLDINKNVANDNYFYSEERYAEKMRKSSQYLSKMPKYPPPPSEYASVPQKSPSGESRSPYFLMRSRTQPMDNFLRKEPQTVRSVSVLSDSSLSKELDIDMRMSPRSRFEGEAISPAPRSRSENYDQFTRSASARLAQNFNSAERAYYASRVNNKDGERKREESMKRLLEWKQRMLQSPLNRKVSQNSSKGISNRNLYYKNHNAYQECGKSFGTLPQYNSYSSDDEENEDGSKENVQLQAGRTTEGFAGISKSHSSAPSSYTTSSNSDVPFDKKNDTTHDFKNSPCTSSETSNYTSCSTLKNDKNENSPRNSLSDDIFEKPLKISNKQFTHTALVSNLRSEYSNKFENSPSMTEIKSNDALVVSILSEFEKNNQFDGIEKNEDDEKGDTVEENYMTMTPKKSVLGPSESFSELTVLELEENPYVEMTHTINTSMSKLNVNLSEPYESQPYEMIYFPSTKAEPVYMELNQKGSYFSNSTTQEEKGELPDILMASQNKTKSKSDSSDADDEASKDLDSLEAPCHPRFSLSDTFRPASYYLGPCRMAPEFQDSSDSELVSPPPIPTSPPPIDDLENVEDYPDDNFTGGDKKIDIFKYSNATTRNFGSQQKGESEVANTAENNLYLTKSGDNNSLYCLNGEANKTTRRLSQTSDSAVEIRSGTSSNSNLPEHTKRRPVSEMSKEFYENSQRKNAHLYSRSNNDPFKNAERLSPGCQYETFGQCKKQHLHNYENMVVVSGIERQRNLKGLTAPSPKRDIQNSSSIIQASHSRENSRDTVTSETSIRTFKSDSSGRSLLSPNEFALRGHSSSQASLPSEMSRIYIRNSPCSTPNESALSVEEPVSISLYFPESNQSDPNGTTLGTQPAPYYYSDLSINTSHTGSSSSILTLNNQRNATSGSKKDISRITNPIRCNNQRRNFRQSSPRNFFNNSFKLAAEARSASADFLNIADKSGNIDKKNLYESDTLKRLKMNDSNSSLQSKSELRNIYPCSKVDKFNEEIEVDANVRRSYSLEGLLENVLNDSTFRMQEEMQSKDDEEETIETQQNAATEGSYVWEEDSVWYERLRLVSQRHTRSLDDLDALTETEKKNRKQPRGISRMVTYVNDSMFNVPVQDKGQESDDAKKEYSNENENSSKESSFIIDREKLRQWDFLSSAPTDAEVQISQQGTPGLANNNVVAETGARTSTVSEITEQANQQPTASGSISINTRDTFPKAIPGKKKWNPNARPMYSNAISNRNLNDSPKTDPSHQGIYTPQMHNHDMNSNTSQNSSMRRTNHSQNEEKINVSAGELLGRTHEELVLLLIQLRRQNSNTFNTIEACYNEIDNIQKKIPKIDAAKRLENLQKLEQIKQHLLELEKQYEKSKPLVNLVDNMVKLGSLYRFPKDRINYAQLKDRLEFNQQIQERRLLAEERRDWNRLVPDHSELQAKVQQLYQLDKLIQEESETLQGLQHDKEEIERALGGLRNKLTKGFNDPAKIQQVRKEQMMLENELCRVHAMLAQNSKKLEETVAGNATLEQELLVLKQKLQNSRPQRSSPQISNAGDSLPCALGTSAMLESDLHRVQQKTGDFQRQRQELSMQVRQLTDRSSNLQQLRSSATTPVQNIHNQKKKIHSLWRETDLDTMHSVDHGDLWESSNETLPVSTLHSSSEGTQNVDFEDYQRGLKSSDSASDDTTLSSNIIPHEKQEIKTVRIVKRESERRQRDREKTTVNGKWDTVLEEDDSSCSSLFKPAPVQKTKSAINLGSSEQELLSRQNSLSNPSLHESYTDTQTLPLTRNPHELSPIFKSEAARQIIIEMSQETPKNKNRRAVPKEKRRHYTAPNNDLIMKSLNQLPTDDKAFDKLDLNSRRARDDLDMERALRQRIDTPDVVRSTLSNKELKYNENTIDNILGTPNKIFIPERYIPEQLPQLSFEEQQHRLRKVESIKKMLSDTTVISGSSANLASESTSYSGNSSNNITNKATSKMIEEKKQREHLLQLNQILAKQVMEMSKIVAAKALASLPLEREKYNSEEEEDYSPETPLPLYQQRDNFYS
ncbi:uncharacterized protein LOC108737573 isoform X2 [Agrilus planipennis]|uniref:Uncharacterized protein LOC108737573 isoform X2 n=1 Tax=Agrilus planipennis TaxID=224129 RepID=A0A1W4X0R3_AGRPL|nr:uncharacterized protein LOC108737573 isoform X2 [Agrilus planipennis]